MGRVLNAGGAWTWNVPMDDKESKLIDLSTELRLVHSLKLKALGVCRGAKICYLEWNRLMRAPFKSTDTVLK